MLYTLLNSINRSPELLKGLYAMGFTRPSKIQERALPLLLAEPSAPFGRSVWSTADYLPARGT